MMERRKQFDKRDAADAVGGILIGLLTMLIAAFLMYLLFHFLGIL